MTFDCAELLSLNHTYNLWGDSLHPNGTQAFSIKGSITGDYSVESISGIWQQMSGMISAASGLSIPIIVNSVNVGTGRVLSLAFEEGTDVRRKNYTASFEVVRHAGSGLYNNSGYLPVNSTYFASNGPNLYDYFVSSTGKYIQDFTESFDFTQTASGKYSYTKNVGFYIDEAITGEFAANPLDYATSVIAAAKRSYGNINVLTAFYPDFYKNQSGIVYTSQSFDDISYRCSYSEQFTFQTGLNYKWDYNHSVSLSEGVISVSENGSILSSQFLTYQSQAAEQAWATIETGIFSRVSGIYSAYTGVLSYSGGCTLKNLPESFTLTKDGCAGKIDYSKSYSNNIFNNTGYIYSYENNIQIDTEGFLEIGERGQIQASPNIIPSGFAIAYSGYLTKSGEISSRISGLYNTYTGSFNTCYTSGAIGIYSEELTLEEHAGRVSYSKQYSDNIQTIGSGLFSKVKQSVSKTEPIHIFNYFPISYDDILTQSASQSTRGEWVNKIELAANSNLTLSQYIKTATGLIQLPSGTDIYIKEYSYDFNPLNRAFSLTAGYLYTEYRTATDILA